MKTGVLLANLGTPEAPTAAAIRPWLREFLSDERVVDLPRALWLPVLYGVILPLRPRKLAPLYASIWRADGSPLLAITREQRAALAARLPATLVVEGMRYGQPSIGDALQRMKDAGVTRLIVLPLYPQYSATTTATVMDVVQDWFTENDWRPELRVVDDYHADPRYIEALAESVREHWSAHGRGERLVLSYHGLPQRYVDRGDPYEKQCLATTRLLASALGLPPAEVLVAYQSRVGRARWLQPYTEDVLDNLAAAGVKNVDVLCPGFAADCLETLDEIVHRYGARFVAAGGQALRYVPALNARPSHIEALAQLAERHLES